MNDAESQGLFAKYNGTPPNRKDAIYQPTDQGTLDIMEIAKAFGFYDAGVTDPRFTERRATQYPILQDLFNGKINPKEAIELYESKLTAIKK
jgi:ABC-type glycerol-3-phosphate transport system substrate-binding protein